MYLCYVDESGLDEERPAVVAAGILIDGNQRLVKTNREWVKLLGDLQNAAGVQMKELKSSRLYEGLGGWGRIDGTERHARIEGLLDWLILRKHRIALATVEKAVDIDPELLHGISNHELLAAFHVALQVQRAQGHVKSHSKGVSLLVMDESKVSGKLTDLLENPPSWSDAYYGRKANEDPFDRLLHTPFWVKSDRIELVQLADLVAFIYSRYIQVRRNGEKYKGELDRLARWKEKLDGTLLPPAHRIPTNKTSPATAALVGMVPAELR